MSRLIDFYRQQKKEYPYEVRISDKIRDEHDLKAHKVREKFAHHFVSIPLHNKTTIFLFKEASHMQDFEKLYTMRIA